MRIAAISDIHANLPALEAVLDDIYSRYGQDIQLVVAGDMLNCGAFPGETLALLRSLPASTIIIAGNHEGYVLEEARLKLSGPRQAPFNALFAPARWTGEQLSTEELTWLNNLPHQAQLEGSPDVRIVHGSPRHQTECVFPVMDDRQLAAIFGDEQKADRLWICGHTHRPALHHWAGMTIGNVGSTGAPYDGDPRAAYLVAEWRDRRAEWQIEHRRVDYDRERTLAALLECASYEMGGPFMRLIWANVKISGYCSLTEFVQGYLAIGRYLPPPDDFSQLDQAIEKHLNRFSHVLG